MRQYVILGAGLDTFAYRNPHAGAELRIFEVDHPTTQAWKRVRLSEARISIPTSLTFAPVDFEKQTLVDGLQRAGFKTGEVTFSWLGVTPYLTRDAIMATLRFIASSTPRGSGVVFDYGISPSLLNPIQRSVFEALAARVAAAGEPWQTFFEPSALAQELGAMGFGSVSDMGPDELNERYFKDRKDDLRVGSLAHLMKAQV